MDIHPLQNALELDEDTVRAVKIGGEWIEVVRGRQAIRSILGVDTHKPTGWLEIQRTKGWAGLSDSLIVREDQIQAVACIFKEPEPARAERRPPDRRPSQRARA